MKYQKGFGIVEVLIAAGILAIVLVSVISVYHSLAAISLDNTDKIQATFLLEEGVEAVRLMRDTNWATNIGNATKGVPYYLRWQGGTWVSTATVQLVDEFIRTVTFTAVNRDTNFDIVTSGGSNDEGSRKATIDISWKTKTGTSTKSVDMYIFNTYNN